MQHRVDQRGLAVVDVGDDREVAKIVARRKGSLGSHASTLSDTRNRISDAPGVTRSTNTSFGEMTALYEPRTIKFFMHIGRHNHGPDRIDLYASHVTESTPFPPPPPPLNDGAPSGSSGRTTLLALATCGLVAAAVTGFLWLGARGASSDAQSERDIAIAERNAASAENIELDARVRVAEDDVAEAQNALSAAESDNDDTTPVDDNAITELQGEIDELAAEVQRLNEENAMRAAAEPEVTEPEPEPEPEVTEPEVTAEPLSPRDLGRRLSSLYRQNVLGNGQQTCLGQVVINDIEADSISEILMSDDPGANESLTASLQNASAICGIDPSAIFG